MKTLLLLLFTTSAFLLVTADSCYAQGFPSTMTQWSTPFGYEATAGNNSTWKWTTMDINGDGLPDMVDTYFNTVYGTAGNNYWEVYLNTGSGFAPTVTQWSTPFGYEHTAGNNSTWKWTTMDMNGDGLPDLVDTYFNTVYGTPGNNYWEVYLNTGSGFSSTATQWSTPFGYEATAGNNSTWKYTTMDINGDGLPDMVDTYFNGVYGTAGNNYWEV
ncbi:MAG: VCBS repeat-containing protein, partial [Crocinitomicaceae bacterium]|nr:VCBS repeat-containing protein [Crocinitomicaceae bacterium]